MSLFDSLGNNLNSLIKNATETHEKKFQQELEKFSNPQAREIDWSPLSCWGTNSPTHDVIIDIHGNLLFRSLRLGKFFGGFSILAGVLVGGFMLTQLIHGFNQGAISGFLLSFIFIWIGVAVNQYDSSMTFDKQLGYFYKNKSKLEKGITNDANQNFIPLVSIIAIQIVYCSTGQRHTYQINLILDKKRRTNVVNHAGLVIIQENAKKLSEYLQVPLWDMSGLVYK